ncbi:MAG: response regulator [Polyangiales bacterium]
MADPISILLVDDDTVDRMALRRALRASGVAVAVTEAEDAAGARAALAARAFDCVLLDLQLPGVDGIALLRGMRAGGDQTPVVMLTGHGDEQVAVEIMQAGAADYIPKTSVSPERLARSVGHALRLYGAERDAAVARRQLEEAERRYRFLAESIPQMVWVCRADRSAEYVNQRWVAYTGFDLEAVNRTSWTDVVYSGDLPELDARWRDAVARGGAFEVQCRIRRSADGEYRWHLSRAEAMTSEGGPLRWFGTSTDIEDQKRAEVELARLAVAADAANRAKDDFLAVLSHELRTPLGSILGWTRMMRQGTVGREEWPRGLDVIERCARVQHQLVEDLLEVSRIISGQLRVERALLDLAAVARAVLEAARPTAEARGVALDARLPEGPLSVEGDAARLQQVIWNLVSNALKFTPAGGRVTLRAAQAGGRVEVTVEDSGSGITPEFLPHVFERFRQAEGPTARRHGGLGLGLSIARALVELHGGGIAAHSEGEGRGARFTFTLPVADASARPASAHPVVAVPGDALRGTRVLVVDDDEDMLDLMTMVLSSRGAVVRRARSVPEARGLFEREAPGVLVSDIGMPGEDGYALIRHVRSLPKERGGEVPAVALTGFAGALDERRASEAGFTRYLRKPVDLDELSAVVSRLAGRAEPA